MPHHRCIPPRLAPYIDCFDIATLSVDSDPHESAESAWALLFYPCFFWLFFSLTRLFPKASGSAVQKSIFLLAIYLPYSIQPSICSRSSNSSCLTTTYLFIQASLVGPLTKLGQWLQIYSSSLRQVNHLKIHRIRARLGLGGANRFLCPPSMAYVK